MLYSLILPYWDRQEAANKAFEYLDKHYRHLDLEVVVVDDGNAVPFKIPQTSLTVRVVRLPLKAKPTPQSKAWNAGVEAAKGEIVILSCVEVIHEAPVLEQLVERLKQEGRNGYVLASAWCPEMQEWHCHTSHKIDSVPDGTGPSFCAAIYKDFFNEVGGFDEVYHEGAGYEDKDFIWRLTSHNAKFVICDDLKVIHPKSGATIRWSAEGFRRNQEIYNGKWFNRKPVTFLCLKAGDAYGPEYVNILFDMVRRNLSVGYPGRFVCLTDNPSGLDDGIQTLPLPANLETWWGKLYMFKRDLFADGERIVFMDLDTLIVGSLDSLARYSGKFACLRDFYYPERLGPAVIAWEAGEYSASIYDEWLAKGSPRHPMGDLWWLNQLNGGRFAKQIDILQDVLPGKFCSYKADCHPYPPKGAAVVCFHGQPKPSNCGAEWVQSVWKVGGTGSTELVVIANTESQKIKENILSACARNIPWLEIKEPHDRQAVIVSGGPSLARTLPEVKWRHGLGQAVIAVNGSAKFLNDQGIVPDIHIVIDAREWNSRFISESKAVTRFLASQCDPATFDASENAVLFHLNTEGIADYLPKDREAHLISSGTTVGLAAMVIAYTQGYRAIHLHGFDSSYDEGHHAYSQPENDQDATVQAVVEGRTFKAAPWMVTQVQQFQELATQLADAGVIITVAGDGLLPFVAQCMSNPQQEQK